MLGRNYVFVFYIPPHLRSTITQILTFLYIRHSIKFLSQPEKLWKKRYYHCLGAKVWPRFKITKLTIVTVAMI